jgi:hypothetical protein
MSSNKAKVRGGRLVDGGREFVAGKEVGGSRTRFGLYSLDGCTSVDFVEQSTEAESGSATALGNLGNIRAGESSEEAFSSIYLRPVHFECGRINHVGIRARR